MSKTIEKKPGKNQKTQAKKPAKGKDKKQAAVPSSVSEFLQTLRVAGDVKVVACGVWTEYNLPAGGEEIILSDAMVTKAKSADADDGANTACRYDMHHHNGQLWFVHVQTTP